MSMSRTVKSKLDQLKDKHTKLVDQVQQAGTGTEVQVVLDKTLDDLTKKTGRSYNGKLRC